MVDRVVRGGVGDSDLRARLEKAEEFGSEDLK